MPDDHSRPGANDVDLSALPGTRPIWPAGAVPRLPDQRTSIGLDKATKTGIIGKPIKEPV
jgi:hypothetical protein